MSDPGPAAVVLAGVHGHGRWHLRNIDRLQRAGVVRLAGVCDVRPPEDRTLIGDVPVATGLDELLRTVRPDVTIVCTPIHTHAGLSVTAAAAGSDVLLEKPPAPTLADFDALVAGMSAAGRAGQVGFQSLGSHAVPYVRALMARGVIGEITGIGAAGTWQRDRSYYARARWAGRRTLDGVAVVDGALTNPLAHATATALALDAETEHGETGHGETGYGETGHDATGHDATGQGGIGHGDTGHGELREVRVELFRANAIEADDTSCVRLVTARGTTITVAATLCAERTAEPYVVVHGTRGRIVLGYTTGRVRLEAGGRVETTEHPSTDLLENLVAHVRDPRVPLLVPLAATRPFMQVVEAVRRAPEPVEIPPPYRRTDTSGAYPRQVVPGIDAAVALAADRLALFSELGLPWAGVPEPADG